MSDIIQFPFQRIRNEQVSAPIFSADIVMANQEILTGLKKILGITDIGLYILSGLDYSNSAYTEGIVVMNGVFYYTSGLAENKYLTPANEDIFNKIHADTNSYFTYTKFIAIQSDTQYGSIPIFSGNMNTYRISNKYLKDSKVDDTDSRLTNSRKCNNTFDDPATSRTNLGLGNSATRNIGNTSGTVCAGDDSRLSNSRTCNNQFDSVVTSRNNLNVYSKSETLQVINKELVKVIYYENTIQNAVTDTYQIPGTVLNFSGMWYLPGFSEEDNFGKYTLMEGVSTNDYYTIKVSPTTNVLTFRNTSTVALKYKIRVEYL